MPTITTAPPTAAHSTLLPSFCVAAVWVTDTVGMGEEAGEGEFDGTEGAEVEAERSPLRIALARASAVFCSAAGASGDVTALFGPASVFPVPGLDSECCAGDAGITGTVWLCAGAAGSGAGA